MDATRVSDGKTVILKRFSRVRDPYEKELTMFLASEPVKSHPRNHFVPVYEVLDIPGEEYSMFVMPVLQSFNDPPFQTVGEALECFRQIFEVGKLVRIHYHIDLTAVIIRRDSNFYISLV